MARRVSFIVTARNEGFMKALDQSAKRLDKFGRRMERTGRKLTRNITVPVAAAAGAALKMAADFESSLSKIEGLVGVARSEVQGMRDDVLALSGETARAPQELADAMFFITSAGLRGADAIDVLEASARGAAAGLGETKDVADLVTSAVNAYGIENLNAAQATDTLVAAVREGKAEAPELAQSLGQVLPIASELGVTFDQVGAATAAMTRTGTDANTAATQLRQILLKLLKPAKESERAFADMGTSSAELRKQLREKGLISVLGFFREQMEDNEQAMALAFPRAQALSGALDLMGSNAEENAQIFKRMEDNTGSLDKAFDAAANTTAFKFNQALSKLRAEAIRFGSIMLPVANKILEGITKMLGNFRQLEKGVRAQILKTAGLFAAGGPLLIGLGIAAKVIAGFATFVMSKTALIGAAFAAIVGSVQWLADNSDALNKMAAGWGDRLGKKLSELIPVFGEFRDKLSAIETDIDQPDFEDPVKFTSFAESFQNALANIKDSVIDLTGTGDSLKAFFSLFEDLPESEGQEVTITRRDITTPEGIERATGSMIRFVQEGQKVETVRQFVARTSGEFTNMNQGLQFAESLATSFTDAFGIGITNVLVASRDLLSTLKNIGSLLLSSGIQMALRILLTGGIGGGITGGLFGSIFGVSDALITSRGDVVQFHPDDNILAMKDFSGIGGGVGVIHNYLYLDGREVFRNQKRIEMDRLR